MEIVTARTARPAGVGIRAAAVEFGLTTAFMATVFGIVGAGIGSVPPGAPADDLRLHVVVVSILVGLVIVAFASSPPGRFSGAHMNPAITLGLFAAGSLPGRRVLPYVVAQLAGSVAAAALFGAAWGDAASREPVRWAVVRPGPGWTGVSVAVTEAVTLAVIMAVMCWMAARRPAWRAPWVVGALFALQGAVFGTLTGGSANPARQWGPALFAGEFHLLVVYLVAPVAGAVLAGWAARRVARPAPVPPGSPLVASPPVPAAQPASAGFGRPVGHRLPAVLTRGGPASHGTAVSGRIIGVSRRSPASRPTVVGPPRRGVRFTRP